MGKYDIFLNVEHPQFVQKIMINNNKKLIAYLYGRYFKRHIDFLEIGPGKGYLKTAVDEFPEKRITYYAMDRNRAMLEHLSIDPERCYSSELPEVKIDRKFDVIFCGYVIEHLKNGSELFETISNLKEHLRENGILVLQFPDCMKMGMQFWNIDYTHVFPTTKRNVNMALCDNGMYVDKSIDINGLLHTRHIESKLEYVIQRAVMRFYSYRICSACFKPVYRKELFDLNNFFYRAYGLLKEENVMFIAKNRE